MYRKHLPLVHHVVRRGFLSLTRNDSMIEYEDLVQEGSVALLRAIRKYNPDKGAFSTFAVKVIANQLLKFVYNQLLQKNKSFPSVSLDAPISDKDGDTFADMVGDVDSAFENIDNKDLWDRLSATLTDRDRDIFFKRVVEGFSYREIGRLYGLSYERISQIYKATLDSLRFRASVLSKSL